VRETALTFVVAPLPNALFSHCGAEDFSTDYDGESSGPIDLGRFITAFIVVTGFSLPLVLAHSEIIKPGASIMSLIGGGYVSSYSAASRLPCWPRVLIPLHVQSCIWNYHGICCSF